MNLLELDREMNYIESRMPPSDQRESYRKTYASINMTIGTINRIKEHRVNAGLSINDVSDITGQHGTTVSRHETKTKLIPASILQIYSRMYGVDIKKLMLQDDTI